MRSIGTVRRYAALAALGVIIGCSPAATATPGSSAAPSAVVPTQATSPSRAAIASASSAPTASPDPRFAGFSACDPQPGFMANDWLCDTVDVPLDRAHPAAGTIPLMVYVLPHTDLSEPAAEPMFTTPGGPGGSGYNNYGIYVMQAKMRAHHDIVTVDPRGTGRSGAIDCPDLQTGNKDHDELLADIRACAVTLAGRTDRYGGADRGMDMEVVRQRLGYDVVDWYAPSYGSVDAQAYVARYPDRVRALVLDAGFEVDDAAMSYWLGPDFPEALVAIAGRQCRRDGLCSGLTDDPEGAIRAMIATIKKKPVTIPVASGPPTVIDETRLAVLLGTAPGPELVDAAVELRNGSSARLLTLSLANPSFNPGGDGDAADFSSGANMAGYCNDQRFAWDPSDAFVTREAKLAALIAMSSHLFKPISAKAWSDAWSFDQCAVWPAPTRFEPIVPAGVTMPDIPTLILSGDVDTSVTTDLSRVLLDRFPKAKLVVVAGAEHPAFSRADACAPNIVATFFTTLDAGDTSCAATAP